MLLPLSMALFTLLAILAGYRVGFVLAGSAALFILISDLPGAFFNLIVSRIHANVLSNWLLVSIPMFIFMGLVLEKTGVAERSLLAAQRMLGGSPAGMGLSVLAIGTLLAASSGIVGASVVLLTVLGLPRLLAAGYRKPLAAGLIASSGTLAILVPPSVMLIVLGDQLQAPIPDMFAGAIGPGLLLLGLYGLYVAWRSPRIEGGALPNRPIQDAGAGSAAPRLGSMLDLLPLLLLALAVLGSIIGGIATPTEASGLGAAGAIAVSVLYRRFSWAAIMEAARDTVLATTVVMMVMVGATCFSAVFRGIGGDEMIQGALAATGAGPWSTLAILMLAIFLLGFVLDWLEITLILMPIVVPVVLALDFGNGMSGPTLLVWFGLLVAVNLQTSFLTPPFGFSLFYMRGAAGDRLATSDIYRGVVPFVALQLLALVIIMVFPQIVTISF